MPTTVKFAPACSSWNFCSSGASSRQGMHQEAQKFTSTHLPRYSFSDPLPPPASLGNSGEGAVSPAARRELPLLIRPKVSRATTATAATTAMMTRGLTTSRDYEKSLTVGSRPGARPVSAVQLRERTGDRAEGLVDQLDQVVGAFARRPARGRRAHRGQRRRDQRDGRHV